MSFRRSFVASELQRRVAKNPLLQFRRKPLKLAQFSIDEFENALYHRDPYTPCVLIAETHAALLNLLRRDVVDDKQEETLPLKAFGLAAPVDGDDGSDAGAVSIDGSDDLQEEKLELITEAAGRYATSWMAKDLSAKDHRKGWEGALVGCLWMVSVVLLPSLSTVALTDQLSDHAY
jgi:bromodomain adjacent to zinc finger domain protein 1A